MTNVEKLKRNKEMAALYKQGKTLNEVGKVYRLTRERVRQLLKKVGVTKHEGGVIKRGQMRRAKIAVEQDKYWKEKTGVTWKTWKDVPTKAKIAFTSQQRNAHRRDIEWNLNRWEWWQLWQQSERWEQMGRNAYSYVLTRRDFSKGFEPGNVIIKTLSEASRSYQYWVRK